jgi:hypothetical protein
MAKKAKEDSAETAEAGEEKSPGEEKSLAEENAKAVEEAEAAAEVSGTPSPTREPEKVRTPIPGTTPDLDVISLDEAHSLNPNVVVSGTKSDGQGGQVLLDVVDPAVANAALLPKGVSVKPQSPSEAPPDTTRIPGEGEVLFETTADNEPFWSGNGVGQGGPLKKGQRVVMTKEEAELLVQTKAGRIVSSAPSDSNAQVEGNDVA